MVNIKYKNSAYIMRIALLLFFSLSFLSQIYSQDVNAKIIIEGKTYYLYKVKKGEGLYRISKNFGVSQQEILDANPDARNGLKEGQLLKIPVISGRNSNISEIQNSGKYIFHTVKKGQTVFYISHKYNVPENVIYDNNPGSRENLIEGTIIKIPVDNLEQQTVRKSGDGFIMHKVKPKETLYGLSKKYGVPQKEIIKANPALLNGVLPVGSMLRIPVKRKMQDTTTGAITENSNTNKRLEDDKYDYYKIQPGETLYSIAKKYNSDVHSLEAANSGLDKDNLPVGYLIRIPKESIKQQKPQKNTTKGLFILHKVKRKET
ncbi:MAG: LysM peptidoglycan-binding domain-containing protein, partial [Chlorobi bacterium]|nr:LysM peptidoglycan-binding domain-containing protein [Chlorobiota bacterium]